MSSAQTESPREAPTGAAAPGAARAAIVVESGDRTRIYRMYEAREITPEGAFLAGALFLEIGETVTLELSWSEGEAVRVSARVVALEHAGTPGMTVAFSHVDDRARSLIQARESSLP